MVLGKPFLFNVSQSHVNCLGKLVQTYDHKQPILHRYGGQFYDHTAREVYHDHYILNDTTADQPIWYIFIKYEHERTTIQWP
jgi:hypothetical protein